MLPGRARREKEEIDFGDGGWSKVNVVRGKLGTMESVCVWGGDKWGFEPATKGFNSLGWILKRILEKEDKWRKVMNR